MITLRYKALKSGKYSLYLDSISRDESGNSIRSCEFIKLYTSFDYSKETNKVTAEDRAIVLKAQQIRKDKELELSAKLKGIKPKKAEKTNASWGSLIEYLSKKYADKFCDRHKRSLLFNLKKYRKEIRFNELTADFLVGFNTFLDDSGLKGNSINAYFRNLNQECRSAIEDGLIKVDPFKDFQIPKPEQVKVNYPTAEEIQKLIETPMPKYPNLKNAYLFSCFTGLRISDIRNLTGNNIKREGEALYLSIQPQKTKRSSGILLHVPLTKPAVLLYETIKKELPNETIFRLPDTSVIFRELKIWTAKAGIDKNLHFHTSRHGFATLSLNSGMDIYALSKMLGHVNIRTTEIDAELTDKTKIKQMAKLPEL